MAKTIEELEEELEEIEDEMMAESSIDVDDKIEITRRSNKDLGVIYGIKKDQIKKINGSRTRFKRWGF